MNPTQGAILFGLAIGVVMLALVFLRGSRDRRDKTPKREPSRQEQPDRNEGTYLSESSQEDKSVPRETECADRL